MKLDPILEKALAIKGVRAAAVVSPDGEIVSGVSENKDGLQFVGGLITSGLASSQVFAKLLGDGEVEQAMIEYEDGPVLMTPLADKKGHVSVLALDSTSALGRARLQMRKLLPELTERLNA